MDIGNTGITIALSGRMTRSAKVGYLESQPVDALEVEPEAEADDGHQGKRVEIAKLPVQFGDVDEVQPGVFRLVRQSTSSPENSAF